MKNNYVDVIGVCILQYLREYNDWGEDQFDNLINNSEFVDKGLKNYFLYSITQQISENYFLFQI